MAVGCALVWSFAARANETETNTPPQFLVSLEDGSCLKGEILLREIPLQGTSVGDLKLPVNRIGCVQRKSDKPVTVVLLNGDSLQGAITLAALPFQTVLGKLSVPVKLVTEIKAVPLTQHSKCRVEVPGTRAERQEMARRIINDARQLDAATDQWALETGQKDGNGVHLREIASYLRDSVLTEALKKGEEPEDLLGNKYTISVVGSAQVNVHPDTKEALKDSGVDWGAY